MTNASKLSPLLLVLVYFGAGCVGAPASIVTAPRPAPLPAFNAEADIETDAIASVPLDEPLLAPPATVAPTSTTARPSAAPAATLVPVTHVVDGDTIDVLLDGRTERLRLIGINTPEVVDPRKPVECFGREASAHAKALLDGASVRLEADSTQDDRDKYGRLLRFVFLADGRDFNLAMIVDGYAYEYTYDVPYQQQAAYRAAEAKARAAKRGLWADDTCAGKLTVLGPKPLAVPAVPPVPTAPTACLIKGNISSGGKIYHLPNCGSYAKTVINESAGERWFCTEAEAQAAGWRQAGNCR